MLRCYFLIFILVVSSAFYKDAGAEQSRLFLSARGLAHAGGENTLVSCLTSKDCSITPAEEPSTTSVAPVCAGSCS